MTTRLILALALLSSAAVIPAAPSPIPAEPLSIGHEPQFLFDQYVVDNHWAIKYKREAVRRVFHPPVKHAGNPILTNDQPSFLWVVRDADAGLFRMYYQANHLVSGGRLADEAQETLPENRAKGRKFRTQIAYAESRDGVNWVRPHLNLFPWFKGRPNNLVIARADNPEFESCAPVVLEVPEADRRGFRQLVLYRAKGRGGKETNGIRVAGSHDGVHFDPKDDVIISHLHSDHHNTISYDAARREYVMYCRAKHIYRAWGEEMIDTGASRRIARLASPALWTDWMEKSAPQTILIPDEQDNQGHFNFFYGMPTRLYAGVYWGFLEPFRMNDFIYTELVTSRDGWQFQRLPGRPKFLEYGPEGSWDDEMNFGSPGWVEVGDEWWFYYAGWDGPHGTEKRTGAIGLAKARKEGLISLRGPAGGGVVATRLLIWPGGPLRVNAAATGGELKVRVSDEKRRPLKGFDHADCQAFTGDSLRHEVTWSGRSLAELKGRPIRLEFYLRDADLFTFRAGDE